MELYEFYNLGFDEVLPISSVHGHGTGDLLDAVCAHVGAADDGNRDSVLFHHRLAEVQMGAHSVQQVAGAVAVHGQQGGRL